MGLLDDIQQNGLRGLLNIAPRPAFAAQGQQSPFSLAGAAPAAAAAQTPDGDYRMAAYGGAAPFSGGAYDNFRRSENIEDRRRQPYSQNPFVLDPNYRREWLSAADEPVSPLGMAAGAHQVQGAAELFSQQRLAGERAEYERRKAAGELVFDSRFEPAR